MSGRNIEADGWIEFLSFLLEAAFGKKETKCGLRRWIWIHNRPAHHEAKKV